MMYMSATYDYVHVGDMLQYSHDNVNHLSTFVQSGLGELDRPVFPNSRHFDSSYLPDYMATTLDIGEEELIADEIGTFANYGGYALMSIYYSFLAPINYLNKCREAVASYNISYYTCREDMFHSNLSRALRVLKYSVQPAHARIHAEQKAAIDYGSALGIAKDRYSRLCNINEGQCRHYDPVFGYCHFGNKRDDIYKRSIWSEDCSLFRRTFGVKGFSYEFNPGQDFWDIYSKNNSYSKLFYDEIFSEDIHSLDSANFSLDSGKTLDFFIFPDSLEKCCLQEISQPQLAIHHPTRTPTKFMKLQRGFRYYTFT